MSAHVSPLPFGLDPLIAEAKRRANRRRLLLLLGVVVVAAGAASATFALRSGGGATGICASAPSGWKERFIPKSAMSEATVVFTNFRFGRADDVYGLLDYDVRWPPDGAMVAVSNQGPDATPKFSRNLRVAGHDFRGFEGAKLPFAQVAVRSHGRVLAAYVEVKSVTPAAIAAANRALAGVRTCSA